MQKSKVLFVCRDNTCRSAMAAAFLNTYFGGRYEAYSCGIESGGLSRQALCALKELGIDTASCRSRKIEDLRNEKFDCLITLCDYARDHLAGLPRHKRHLHQGFKDFCLVGLCKNATKTKLCFPGYKKTHPRFHGNSGKAQKNVGEALRYLREAIFNWVENEAVF